MNSPKDCSSVWRNILNARKKVIDCIQYVIADGKDNPLWSTPWWEGLILSENNSARSELALPVNAKVSSLITAGQWNSNVLHIQNSEPRESIMGVKINKFLPQDTIVWKLSEDEKSNDSSAYRMLRPKRTAGHWHGMV